MSAPIQTNPTELVSRALALHQSGHLVDAERLYKQILKVDPRQFEAMHFLGLIEAQRQNFEEADRLMSKSLQINSRTADAYANHARVLNALKRPEAAIAQCEKALSINPRSVSALISRGIACKSKMMLPEALESYERALKINSSNGPAWANRGAILWALDRRAEAFASYEAALKVAPNLLEALNSYGDALREVNRYPEALACAERALAIKPGDVSTMLTRAQLLGLLRRIDEALVESDKVLALEPDNVSAWITRGDALTALHRPIEALEAFDRALTLQPDHLIALTTRTNALQGLNRYQEALRDLEHVQFLAQEYPDAQVNEALVRFCLGDLRKAWEKYEWRWKCKDWSEKPRPFPQPLWLGQEPLAGRSILLHAEQGLGDTLHFIRYASLVAELGARVVLEVQPALKGLALEIKGLAAVIGRGETLPECDFHCPLLSLPLAFGTEMDTIPSKVPYLYAPAERVDKWKARFPKGDVLRVGLAWSGNPGNPLDAIRSMSLMQLASLFELKGIAFVSLQKDIRSHDAEALRGLPQIVDLGPDLKDFGDTAAVIEQLDAVIAVDTAVAHLAGALGRPLFIPLPFSPGWRWLLDRDDSPWYPSARLFRQPNPGDWDSVIRQLKHHLQSWSRAKSGTS